VRLRSQNPSDAPLIDPGYYTHPDDLPRMLETVRIAQDLVETEPLAELRLERHYPGPQADSDSELEEEIRAGIRTYHHPVGTCRMGAADDPDAVVGANGKVHGVEGLYVVDASIMPTIPAANTNVPTLMVAERCSDWLLKSL
jgi:choline dehydrogenase